MCKIYKFYICAVVGVIIEWLDNMHGVTIKIFFFLTNLININLKEIFTFLLKSKLITFLVSHHLKYYLQPAVLNIINFFTFPELFGMLISPLLRTNTAKTPFSATTSYPEWPSSLASLLLHKTRESNPAASFPTLSNSLFIIHPDFWRLVWCYLQKWLNRQIISECDRLWYNYTWFVCTKTYHNHS